MLDNLCFTYVPEILGLRSCYSHSIYVDKTIFCKQRDGSHLDHKMLICGQSWLRKDEMSCVCRLVRPWNTPSWKAELSGKYSVSGRLISGSSCWGNCAQDTRNKMMSVVMEVGVGKSDHLLRKFNSLWGWRVCLRSDTWIWWPQCSLESLPLLPFCAEYD